MHLKVYRKQRRRFLIFLVVPILAAVLLWADDMTIRIIALALIIIYVAFIIFLRDSLKFQGTYIENSYEDSIIKDDSKMNQNHTMNPSKLFRRISNLR